MPGETVPHVRTATPAETKGGTLRQETAAMASGLERLRATLLERLGVLETGIRQRMESAPLNEAEIEQRDRDVRQRATETQQRVTEIEELQRRIRAERERWETERQALIEQLEHDRRLLAEAWETLEREKADRPDQPQNGPLRAERVSPQILRPVIASDDNNPVEQAILRQFQAVRRDVRRNVGGAPAG